MLENNTVLETKAIKQLYQTKMLNNKVVMLLRWVFYIAVAVLVYSCISNNQLWLALSTIVAVATFTILMLILVAYIRNISHIEEIKGKPIVNYKFDEESIWYICFDKNENSERKIDLKYLMKIVETKDYFFMVLATNEGLILNKKCFVGGSVTDFKKRFGRFI